MTPDIKFYLRLMSRRLLAMTALFLLASGIGFVVAASNGVTLDGHDHAQDH